MLQFAQGVLSPPTLARDPTWICLEIGTVISVVVTTSVASLTLVSHL